MNVHPKSGGQSDYDSKNFTGKIFTFELANKNESASMKDSHGIPLFFPPSYNLPLVDEIFDKKKGTRRVIRVIPGKTSIYEDEQNLDNRVAQKNYHTQFINGLKAVDGTDNLLLKFIMECNYNGSNPDRDPKKPVIFKLVDKSIAYKAEIEKDLTIHKAKNWCYEAAYDEVRAYARVLSIPHMESKSSEEIRWDMSVRAQKDPKKFMDGLNDPKMKKKHHILEALERGILSKNESQNSICWSSNLHSPLKTAPAGLDPVDILVDSIITPDGEKFYDALLGMLHPATHSMPEPGEEDKLKAKQAIEGKPRDIIAMADITNMQVAELVSEAIEKGVMTKKGPWWYFGENKWQGDAVYGAIKGSEELVLSLQKQLNEKIS
jgi:hypothetical protein